MTAETCPRCGRPRPAGTCVDVYETCSRPGSSGCRHAAAAYRRGIDEGVRLAKEKAKTATDPCCAICSEEINWTDVDAAAAKAKGEP